jgi:DNA-binding XRE family transcriptional regulator
MDSTTRLPRSLARIPRRNLTAVRESKGLSLTQAASELGLKSRSSLHDIESGRQKCSLRLALRIEAWSGGGVPAEELCPEAAGLIRQLAARAAG